MARGPGRGPREVVVPFGTATLVITDIDERPLGHWALAGTRAIEQADGSVLYAISADRYETLTVRDREMVAAIAAVLRAHLDPPRRRSPRDRASRRGSRSRFSRLVARRGSGPAPSRRGLPHDAARTGRGHRCAHAADPGGHARAALHRPRRTCGPRGAGRAVRAGRSAAPARPRSWKHAGRRAAGNGAPRPRSLASAAAPEAVAGWIAIGLTREAQATHALMAAAGPLAGARYLLSGTLSIRFSNAPPLPSSAPPRRPRRPVRSIASPRPASTQRRSRMQYASRLAGSVNDRRPGRAGLFRRDFSGAAGHPARTPRIWIRPMRRPPRKVTTLTFSPSADKDLQAEMPRI